MSDDVQGPEPPDERTLLERDESAEAVATLDAVGLWTQNAEPADTNLAELARDAVHALLPKAAGPLPLAR